MPRLSAELRTADGALIDSWSTGIRAEGRKIAADASAEHGITSAQAERGGIYELFALGAICGLKKGPRRASDYPGLASNARFVIAWDADRLRAAINDAFLRHGEPAGAWVRPGLTFVSLKQNVAPWCFTEAVDGVSREPTLAEAAKILLTDPPSDDMGRIRALYAWLAERNVFEEAA